MKVCFWGNFFGEFGYNTLGGGELQISLIARSLARTGHEVVVLDISAKKGYKTADGITVVPFPEWDHGTIMLRSITHRLPKLYSALLSQRADIYYCRIRDFRHILAYRAARKNKARFILGLASDLDISDFRTRWKHFYASNLRSLWDLFNGIFSELVYPFLIRKSDSVFVQHDGQRKVLEKKNIQPVVFPNLIDPEDIPEVIDSNNEDFIYVGGIDKRKGFVDFSKLVDQAPLKKYKIVGLPRDKTGWLLYERIRSMSNVTCAGQLNHKEVLNQISRSKALISTSPMEGFPNVFLEAWACGIPVLSLHNDPGNVITDNGLGKAAYGDLNLLIKSMDEISNEEVISRRVRNYISDNHLLSAGRANAISEIFNKILGGHPKANCNNI